MLKKYEKEFIGSNCQFILADSNSVILESTPAFLPIKKGELLTDLHPFFECIPSLVSLPERVHSFYCIHLSIANSKYITDIQIRSIEKGQLVLIQDLTKHYNNYQAVAQARNESIINEELIVLKNVELEERELFKNLFIQNFSHELRNPLMSSIAVTQILSDTDLNTEQRQLVEVLRESNANLKLLLEDILSISMIASGKLELRHNLFNLAKLLELLAFTYRTKATSKGLTFEISVDNRVPEFVEGDRLRLFQVLTNLLDNAINYTEKGTVSLEVMFNQQWANKIHLHFVVSDTGRGIPEDRQGIVFESFSQLTLQDKEKGTGLGLALVKGLLALMESEIALKSAPGKGSVFSFDLGLKVPLSFERSATTQSPSKGTSRNIGKPDRKYKLLLVEDDERIQTLLFKVLMDTDQFYLDIINDGAQVLEQVIQNSYDLILMDINLPNTRGDHLTKIIRDFPFKNIKQLPIIGMTAFAYEDHLKTFKDAGMNKVLTKPFDKEELLSTIFAYL
ncbi:ATP-binding protein [uncultured Eudoraea sp.]|uniref:ATP-binding response regulator n=1 Tax=uncultured Eudoraea sp. TaxID=1035614 RepID=UPI002620E3E8|nr:ATP-binding protein [uncultured Eudoraea sp.]